MIHAVWLCGKPVVGPSLWRLARHSIFRPIISALRVRGPVLDALLPVNCPSSDQAQKAVVGNRIQELQLPPTPKSARHPLVRLLEELPSPCFQQAHSSLAEAFPLKLPRESWQTEPRWLSETFTPAGVRGSGWLLRAFTNMNFFLTNWASPPDFESSLVSCLGWLLATRLRLNLRPTVKSSADRWISEEDSASAAAIHKAEITTLGAASDTSVLLLSLSISSNVAALHWLWISALKTSGRPIYPSLGIDPHSAIQHFAIALFILARRQPLYICTLSAELDSSLGSSWSQFGEASGTHRHVFTVA